MQATIEAVSNALPARLDLAPLVSIEMFVERTWMQDAFLALSIQKTLPSHQPEVQPPATTAHGLATLASIEVDCRASTAQSISALLESTAADAVLHQMLNVCLVQEIQSTLSFPPLETLTHQTTAPGPVLAA